MDNQKLKGLIAGWRSTENKLRTKNNHPGYTDIEAWEAANAVSICASDLEILILLEEEYK